LGHSPTQSTRGVVVDPPALDLLGNGPDVNDWSGA
jgi:hypothetical protein